MYILHKEVPKPTPAVQQQQAPSQVTSKSEIYQVFEQISQKTGLPPQKVQLYTKAFEDQEVYNKQAL